MTRSADWLRLTGMGAILLAAFIRAMTAECSTPYWDLDPLLTNLPETTLLPSMGLALDALVWLGVAAAILGESLAGRRIMWKSGILLAIGTLGVLLHALVLPPIGAPGLHTDFASLIRGSAWAAAMAGAWGVAHLARDASVRRVVGIGLLGFVILLAGVGAFEYFREHAMTVAQFDADPAAALAAQGMEPGTAAALAFERRLRQPEAIAWFGLANVYGSFAAAAFVGWLGLTLACRRANTRHMLALGACACAIAAGAVVMSGSKGAAGAAILGVGVLVISAVPPLRKPLARWRWAGPTVALAVVAAPLGAVAIRGAIGQRIGELSLLFRSQYAIAALRVFAEHPLLGVGPAGFKIAYATTKVPASPEWVDSPHSLTLDWSATLGLFGIAWILVWLWWIVRAGRGLADVTPDQPSDQRNSRTRLVGVLAILIAILFSWRLDMATTLRAEMAVRALAGALWVAVLYAPIPVTRAALGAAALAMAAHMQIEMTGVRTTSALPAMLLIGLAAAPSSAAPGAHANPRRFTAGACAAFALLAGALIAIEGALPAARWESHLRRAADLIHAHERPVPPATLIAAQRELLEADAIIPSLDDPLLQAARLAMTVAQGAEHSGDHEAAARDSAQAIAIANRAGARFADDSVVWSRLGLLEDARYRLLGDRADLEAAAAAWERAAALDPLALTPAVQAWRLNAELGHTTEARARARRALELNALLHLDPVVQLSERVRRAIEKYLADVGTSSGSTPPAEPPQGPSPSPE